MVTLLRDFLGLFAFMTVFGYLLPAGRFFYRYHLRPHKEEESLRLQQRLPGAPQVRREIWMSLQSLAIFAAMGAVLFALYRAGRTSIYWGNQAGDWWYVPVSFLGCVVFHDAYFYWTHRLMHWRPIFKYVHAGHHRSIAPTPWAIYAFQPAEAAIQFVGIMLLVIFLPLRPLVFLAFLSYDTFINTAGHTGFEIAPRRLAECRALKWFNTVAHHDSHHTHMATNYGVFFNLWDRLMGTFRDAPHPETIAKRALPRNRSLVLVAPARRPVG